MSKDEKATRNWDHKATGPFLLRIMALQSDIDAINDEAKEKTSVIGDDIKAVKKEASDEGFPRREFNKMIKTMKGMNQEVKSYNKLSQDEKEVYDIMREAAGLPPMEEIMEQIELKV